MYVTDVGFPSGTGLLLREFGIGTDLFVRPPEVTQSHGHAGCPGGRGGDFGPLVVRRTQCGHVRVEEV